VRRPLGPALLVVAATVSQEVGAAFAVGLFAALGAVGAVFARFAIAGVLLWLAVRPRITGLKPRAWGAALALAISLTVMNLCFYNALTRIPLGVAVTIEVLGPLILSVVVSRRRIAWLWALLALTGVAILGLAQDTGGDLDPVGFLFAGGAAAAWACYILASAEAGAQLPRVDGLAIATAMGALATAPFAAVSIGATDAVTWRVMGLAVTVGLMCSVLPYSLELIALRSLSPETMSILVCLSPVIAAIAGRVVLGQELGLLGYVAISLVTAASVGAVRSSRMHTAAVVDQPPGGPDAVGRLPDPPNGGEDHTT